jgi:hypothetical protein
MSHMATSHVEQMGCGSCEDMSALGTAKVTSGSGEAALIDLGIADRNDPFTELIAKSILNVAATGSAMPC